MTKFGAAQGIKRVEDFKLITGQGRYTDDIVLDRQSVGFVLRSPHAAARIVSLDATTAKAMPGVLAIYTADDLDADGIGRMACAVPMKNRDGTPRKDPHRAALAEGRVRHVGDPVAFIVAETLAAARDAAEAIVIDYDILPAVSDMRAAMAPDAPRVWDDATGNVCFDWATGDKAKVDAAFASAAKVVEIEVENNKVVVASIEGRACNVAYDAASGRYTIYAGTQGAHGLRNALAPVLDVSPDKLHVITNDVGGGFGMKIFIYPEYVLCAFAARKLGRPVKWTSERNEAFLSDTQGRAQIMRARLALDAKGNFLALDAHNIADMGAYLSTYSVFIPTMAGTKVLPSVYKWGAVHAQVVGVFTNTPAVDAYRGAGRPESNYLVERLIDKAAAVLGVDRVKLRQKNMVPPSKMPWKAALGSVYDSGDFPGTMKLALEVADWDGAKARKRVAKKAGKRRGIGVAYYLEATGGAPSERAEIRFAADGMVDVLVGTQSTGQGHETAYMQLVSAQLGVPFDKLRVIQGDSDIIKSGGGTGGARSLYSEGGAILAAADVVVTKGKASAADVLEAAASDIEFANGVFSIVGTDRKIGVLALADELRRRGVDPAKVLDGAADWAIASHTYPNGCHVAEVELDPATGVVKVVRYVVADDMGNVINPMIVAGQIHGGVVQGIGQALTERTVFDADGQMLSATFMDYATPRADDAPDITVVLNPVPCTTNPLGVKGAGEAGSVGSCPAVMNALADALSEWGADVDMPATPERVWRAIRSAQAKAAE
jgi:carbon-monoxide dehydrogenase large subunit